MDANVIKSGEIIIQTRLQRNSDGLTIECRAHPRIEDFFRAQSNDSSPVGNYGRHWISKEPLRVHSPIMPLDYIRLDDGNYVTADRVGQPIMEGRERPNDTINLSFLRLVGISEGSGIRFGLKGVYSLDALKKLKEQLQQAERRFYLEFMRPIDMTITMSGQEVHY